MNQQIQKNLLNVLSGYGISYNVNDLLNVLSNSGTGTTTIQSLYETCTSITDFEFTRQELINVYSVNSVKRTSNINYTGEVSDQSGELYDKYTVGNTRILRSGYIKLKNQKIQKKLNISQYQIMMEI